MSFGSGSSSAVIDDPASPEFGQRLLALFEELVELAPEQREPRLVEASAGAPQLQKALRALLARDAPGFRPDRSGRATAA